jgi:putative oxygen-independent coproporphyrinogen III oxidase
MIDVAPLSLYIHLPWCIRKCPYCDFNSHTAGDAPPRDRYLKALLKDLKAEGQRAAGRKVCSVFIGGGTPSLFDGSEIARIIHCIAANVTLDADAEITMEANPGAVEHGNLAAYRQAGVNRLSIGAQSFDASTLKRLGRIHGPQEIDSTFAGAREAGFHNVNLDIMFALPGQSLEMALNDVEKAIRLGPEHISYYQLTLEPNTIFHSSPPADMPDDDLSWSIQQAGQDALQKAGYEQYEISAFARPARQCKHNLNYWGFGDYLAAGAGAHGKITDLSGAVWRYQKTAHPTGYMDQAAKGKFDARLWQPDKKELTFEFMLNSLRLTSGFTEQDFRSRTGQPISVISPTLGRAQTDGLLNHNSPGHWQPTALGSQFLNDLQARFL